MKPSKYVVPAPQCIGCGICRAACATGCIRMVWTKGGIAVPKVDGKRCVGCGQCQAVCAAGAVVHSNRRLRFDYGKCIRCYCCHEMCPFDAIVFREGVLMRVFKALGLARR